MSSLRLGIELLLLPEVSVIAGARRWSAGTRQTVLHSAPEAHRELGTASKCLETHLHKHMNEVRR